MHRFVRNFVQSYSYHILIGQTGHAEALSLTWDNRQASYEELLGKLIAGVNSILWRFSDFFFRTHDPTQVDRQGADIGTQYRTALYPTTDNQFSIANRIRDEVQETYFTPKSSTIATVIHPTNKYKWWKAEDYHQQYLLNNPDGYQCYNHRLHY